MKKILTLIFTMLALMGASAFAQDDIRVMYNGEYLEFTDASPVIVGGRTLLPFRSVFEQMGAAVSYDDSTRTARADFGGNVISFSLDGREIVSSLGPVYTMDVPPEIINGRTLVPVRAVAEAGGLTVDWDNDERTVVVMDENAIFNTLAADIPGYWQIQTLSAASPEIYAQTEALNLTMETGEVLDLRGETSADGQSKRVFFTAETDGEKYTTEMIITASAIYLKSDMIGAVLAETSEDNPFTKLISPEKWYYIDLNELETFISGDARGLLPAAAGDIMSTPLCLTLANDYLKELSQDLMHSYTASELSPAASARNVFGVLLPRAKAVAENELNVTSNGAETLVTVPCQGGGQLEAVYSGGRLSSAKIDGVFDGTAVKGTVFARPAGEIVEKIEIPENTVNFVDVLYTALRLS